MNRTLARGLSVAVVLVGLPRAAHGQATARISIASDSTQANDTSGSPSISADGRYVAFSSQATNLIPDRSTPRGNLYVRDRFTGAIEIVSVGFGAPQGAGGSSPKLSNDGRFVAFQSHSSSVVSGDTNVCEDPFDPNSVRACSDVFLRDRDASTTIRVSVGPAGVEGNGDSYVGDLSANGGSIAFFSVASNLVLVDSNGHGDVFVYDTASGVATLVSRSSTGQLGNGWSGTGRFADGGIGISLSADGRFVAFTSEATNLVTGDTNGRMDVFVRDRSDGTTTRVSVRTNGTQGNDISFKPSISDDGRYVAFASLATNLTPEGQNGVFVHDRQTSTTTWIARGTLPSISGDGRTVAFSSPSTDLVPGDTNGVMDVFVRTLDSGATTRVSVDSVGRQADLDCVAGPISKNGRFVPFTSLSPVLVPGDTNGFVDVFVHDREPCAAGNVGGTSGPVDVLFVNGSAGASGMRLVDARRGEPITVSLANGPFGPSPASYALWVSRDFPSNQFFLQVSGETIGCTGNPTPLQPRLASPQPIRCLVGGLGPEFCGAVPGPRHVPTSAPWSLTKSAGFPQRLSFTLQGVVEDSTATNSLGLAVTNLVVLRIR